MEEPIGISIVGLAMIFIGLALSYGLNFIAKIFPTPDLGFGFLPWVFVGGGVVCIAIAIYLTFEGSGGHEKY